MTSDPMPSAAVFFQVQSQRTVYQEFLKHFMLPTAKLYGDAGFRLQQYLAPVHSRNLFPNHNLLCLTG